jgi:hypothetical protein
MRTIKEKVEEEELRNRKLRRWRGDGRKRGMMTALGRQGE